MRPQLRRRWALVALVALLLVVVAIAGPQVAHGVKSALEALMGLPGPVFALVVGLLALAETAAFAGLAVPGELAVILGGVVAAEGRVPLGVMIACAVVGAILGDSLGFSLGRRFGVKLLDGRLGALMGRERVVSTMARVRSGGIKAVILGRFVGLLRAIMPFAAGASGMSYGRFLAASVLGATAWGSGFTLLGYAAGESYDEVERYAGRATSVLVAVLVVVGAIVWGARKANEHQQALRARWDAFLVRPRVAALDRRYGRQFGFLANRFRPGPAAGLQLTVALLLLALLGYALALVVGQVLGRGGLLDVDAPVRRFFERGRTSELDDVADVVRAALGPWVVVVVAVLTGVATWVADRRPRGLVLLVTAAAGGWVLAEGVQEVTARAGSITTFGSSLSRFPSARITALTALALALVVVLGPRMRWRMRVTLAAALLVVVALGAVAELAALAAAFSDVIGGLVVGATWALVVATAVTTVWRPGPRVRPDSGDEAALSRR